MKDITLLAYCIVAQVFVSFGLKSTMVNEEEGSTKKEDFIRFAKSGVLLVIAVSILIVFSKVSLF